ncbi:MAG TPA: histidine--tRNA ligase [Solirubrobacteraceae bacterium]|nr:histidine--tRNA ligase [Solirubrobacteraceae bacterium]
MPDPKIRAPRGTFDVLGEQAGERETLAERARAILEGAGYERIETPVLEATELFARGVGESTDIVSKEMFTLTDGAGRSLTLRPEGTAPVCRAYVEHGMHKRRQPVKLWYLSSFFRSERAQAGRYRQFWQVGAEALGSEDPAVDAESIALLARLLSDMGVADVRLRVSSLGSAESRGEHRERLQAHLRAHEQDLSAEVRARIEHNPLRAFDSDHEGTRRVMASAPRLLDHLDTADAEHFAQVRALLDTAGVAYEVDATLVRGLDYYTRTVFEFTSDALGAQSGVGGGGRYDGLVQRLGGPPTPGMGWAAGVERMLLAGDAQPAPAPVVQLFLALDDQGRDGRDHGGEDELKGPPAGGRDGSREALRLAAFELLGEARAAGLTAQMELQGRSLKGQLGHADALGARYVAILSSGGEAVLKDMQGGDQERLPANAVVHAVLRGLHEL